MPKSIPRRFDSCAACLTSFHQGSVQEIISGVGFLPMPLAQGVVMFTRLNIVVRLKPAFSSSSKSFVMPCLVRLAPIHIQSTPGRAALGGFIKTFAGFVFTTELLFTPVPLEHSSL